MSMFALSSEQRDSSGTPRVEQALWTALGTIACFSGAFVWGRDGNLPLVTAISALVSLALAAATKSVAHLDLCLASDRASGFSERLHRRRWLGQLTVGVILGALLVAATRLAYFVVVSFLPSIEVQTQELYGFLSSSGPLLSTMPLLAWVVVVEEIVWRGILFPSLADQWSKGWALLVVTLLYATPQLFSGSWLLVVVALVFGFLWTLQRACGASLMSVVLTHLVWDVGIFYLFPVVPLV